MMKEFISWLKSFFKGQSLPENTNQPNIPDSELSKEFEGSDKEYFISSNATNGDYITVSAPSRVAAINAYEEEYKINIITDIVCAMSNRPEIVNYKKVQEIGVLKSKPEHNRPHKVHPVVNNAGKFGIG